MNQAKDDPHGVQQLLAILRRQQDSTQPSESGQSSANTGTEGRATTQAPRAAGARSDGRALGQEAQTQPETAPRQDLRHVSFAQALPHLTQLSKDERFLKALLDLKARQDSLEEKLANEYSSIATCKRSKEADNEIVKWSRDALARWDRLLASQQRQLQDLGVPCFFVTTDEAHRRRQERVFDVLAGLLE